MNRRYLIWSLMFLALGAFLLHFRIHPIYLENTGQFSFPGFLATILIIVDVLLVPYFLSCKDTAAYGFLLNGMIAILGVITMAHFTFARLDTMTLYNLLFKSTLADILIVFADFLISKVVYDSYFVAE